MKRQRSLWAAVLFCIFAIVFTGCGNGAETDQSGDQNETKAAADGNRNILEDYVRGIAEDSDVIAGEEFDANSDTPGLISYAILETNDGKGNQLLTVSDKGNKPAVLEVQLFGTEGETVKEIDSETIDFNDAECFGGEYDLFLTNCNGDDYLFVKRNNVVDSSSCFSEGLLYSIGESIEKQLDAQASGATEGFGFLINDGEPITASFEDLPVVFSDWADEANGYLQKAGLSCEGDYYDTYSLDPLMEAMPNHDSENPSEKQLCFIRKGRQENGKVDDFEHADIMEINDFTGAFKL